MLVEAMVIEVNPFLLACCTFFFFFKETVVVEYRKTNGELGREELSFQLGEMEGIQLKQSVSVFCFCHLGSQHCPVGARMAGPGIWGRKCLPTSAT